MKLERKALVLCSVRRHAMGVATVYFIWLRTFQTKMSPRHHHGMKSGRSTPGIESYALAIACSGVRTTPLSK